MLNKNCFFPKYGGSIAYCQGILNFVQSGKTVLCHGGGSGRRLFTHKALSSRLRQAERFVCPQKGGI